MLTPGWIRRPWETAQGSGEPRPRTARISEWKPSPGWGWTGSTCGWTCARRPAILFRSRRGNLPGCGSEGPGIVAPGWKPGKWHPSRPPARAWRRRPDCRADPPRRRTAASRTTGAGAIRNSPLASGMLGQADVNVIKLYFSPLLTKGQNRL